MLYPKDPRRDRIFLEIDNSLELLGWDLNTARGYLNHHYNCISRHQLTDDQLNRQLDYYASNPQANNKLTYTPSK
jgi:hypothetical protein